MPKKHKYLLIATLCFGVVGAVVSLPSHSSLNALSGPSPSFAHELRPSVAGVTSALHDAQAGTIKVNRVKRGIPRKVSLKTLIKNGSMDHFGLDKMQRSFMKNCVQGTGHHRASIGNHETHRPIWLQCACILSEMGKGGMKEKRQYKLAIWLRGGYGRVKNSGADRYYRQNDEDYLKRATAMVRNAEPRCEREVAGILAQQATLK